jgi:hypothetical protein
MFGITKKIPKGSPQDKKVFFVTKKDHRLGVSLFFLYIMVRKKEKFTHFSFILFKHLVSFF